MMTPRLSATVEHGPPQGDGGALSPVMTCWSADATVAGERNEAVGGAVMEAGSQGRGLPRKKRALLTARECQVLLEISHGASNKQVARRLAISPSTVRTHVESIFRKLHCSTRAAAAARGIMLGLIP